MFSGQAWYATIKHIGIGFSSLEETIVMDLSEDRIPGPKDNQSYTALEVSVQTGKAVGRGFETDLLRIAPEDVGRLLPVYANWMYPDPR